MNKNPDFSIVGIHSNLTQGSIMIMLGDDFYRSGMDSDGIRLTVDSGGIEIEYKMSYPELKNLIEEHNKLNQQAQEQEHYVGQ